MTYKIGFVAEEPKKNVGEEIVSGVQQSVAPRRSLVQIYFAGRNMTLAYYNDRFDLHCGDMVYVDGKLEGMLGCVTEVSYNFKIRLSDYKHVIALVDTNVSGEFFLAGSHALTFDRHALPAGKVIRWFQAPAKEEDEIVSGYDDTSFPLNDLKCMNVSPAIAERGEKYYLENRVRYISIDGAKGYAIVEGSQHYEVEFEYRDGEISGLVCSCFCSYYCKHAVAAMLQLREILDYIEKNYSEEYRQTGYFAAICKKTLLTYGIDRKETGRILL